MMFTLGFALGWLWGIFTVLTGVGLVLGIKDRREEWHRGMDGLLRTVSEERKARNRERMLEAVRQVIRERQDVAWRN